MKLALLEKGNYVLCGPEVKYQYWKIAETALKSLICIPYVCIIVAAIY